MDVQTGSPLSRGVDSSLRTTPANSATVTVRPQRIAPVADSIEPEPLGRVPALRYDPQQVSDRYRNRPLAVWGRFVAIVGSFVSFFFLFPTRYPNFTRSPYRTQPGKPAPQSHQITRNSHPFGSGLHQNRSSPLHPTGCRAAAVSRGVEQTPRPTAALPQRGGIRFHRSRTRRSPGKY